MTSNRRNNPKAFTLLELTAAVVVMSIISVVLLPVLSAASDAYITTRTIRTSTEQSAYALDRIARIIRQAPIGPGDEGVGIQSATLTSLEFTDGTGFEINDGALEMLVPGSTNAKLCPNIDDLVIQYFADDGITSTLATPTQTHRICVTLTSGELRMSMVVHPRVWIGQEGS